PTLEQIFETAFDLKNRIEAKADTIQALEERGTLDPAQLTIERSQLEFLAECLEEALSGVDALGASVKGLNPALVDFPHRLDGKEIHLCWQYGEKNIQYFHGLEEGFAGRKPLSKKPVSH